MYVRKYFPKESKALVWDMIESIRSELFLNDFDLPHVMALEKSREMFAYVGYSDGILDNSTIEKYYEHLKINETNYLLLEFSIAKFNTGLVYKKLREPVGSRDLLNFEVNAIYEPIGNTIRKKKYIHI